MKVKGGPKCQFTNYHHVFINDNLMVKEIKGWSMKFPQKQGIRSTIIFSLPNHLAVIDFKGIEDEMVEKDRNESKNHSISLGDKAYQLQIQIIRQRSIIFGEYYNN